MSRTAEFIARTSYGRLLATVAARTRDISAAEDALAEAFEAALVQWPREGVPANPDAWLVTAARRRLIDAGRRTRVHERHADGLAHALETLAPAPEGQPAPPDERLKLLFVCTHPAIERGAQVPLMLQTVLGLDADQIASALRVAPKTMGQRLWRAKTRIRETGISFELPDLADWPLRVEAVLDAVYVAFGTAWEDAAGTEPTLRNLNDEAIYLARLVTSLMPRQAEALGLLALMLFAEARRPARRDAAGRYVPLARQDQTRWNVAAIDEAEAVLRRAFALGQPGPFQLEAAIQSAHVDGLRAGRVDHEAIVSLYVGLLSLGPSLGAAVGHASALLDARGPDACLSALDALPTNEAQAYQPWWVVRGEALAKAGRPREAHQAWRHAIGLTEDAATRAYLESRAAAVATGSSTGE